MRFRPEAKKVIFLFLIFLLSNVVASAASSPLPQGIRESTWANSMSTNTPLEASPSVLELAAEELMYSDCMIDGRATPIIKNHKLFTSDGQPYEFITPDAKNYGGDSKLINHKYVIIHFTTGIDMEQTISWFTSETSKVSAHLLIGRDGSVVQFVDFDTPAYHAGTSHWEGDHDLNRYSIGIELDNGGRLDKNGGVWIWHYDKPNATIIPNEEVREVMYWKDSRKTGWHRFSRAQLCVALAIVLALKKEYDDIEIILGHDAVNVMNKEDPGPLFPMNDFREIVLGRSDVLINTYMSIQETPIYYNTNYEPPDVEHPRYNSPLPANSKVIVLNATYDIWTLVRVEDATGRRNKPEGWIRKKVIDDITKRKSMTTEASVFYKINPRNSKKAPPTLLENSPIPAGTRLRIERFKDDWALVVLLDRYLEGWVKTEAIRCMDKDRYLEGSVKTEDLVCKDTEWMIYPPLFEDKKRPECRVGILTAFYVSVFQIGLRHC